MDKSFSLQFNPLTNVKSVKEYEEEISKLKMENFELKSQLAHSQVPKILYENKVHLDKKEEENKALLASLENSNRNFEALKSEKLNLEIKYNEEISMSIEKMALLEDENKRLVFRLEKLNKENIEMENRKDQLTFELQRKTNESMDIPNLRSLNDQLKYELEAKKTETDGIISELKYELEAKKTEMDQVISELQNERLKGKNSALVINDLKNTLNNCMQQCAEKEQGLKGFSHGLAKFKTLLLNQINLLNEALMKLNERLLNMKKTYYLSEDNKSFLNKLETRNLNDGITLLRDKTVEYHKRVEILKRELTDTTKSMANNKDRQIGETLNEFREQFNEAKKELMICRSYLEKKALENKNLKNLNSQLEYEIKKRGVAYPSVHIR